MVIDNILKTISSSINKFIPSNDDEKITQEILGELMKEGTVESFIIDGEVKYRLKLKDKS